MNEPIPESPAERALPRAQHLRRAPQQNDVSSGWLIASAVAMGIAAQLRFGAIHPMAIVLLTVALLAGAVGVLGGKIVGRSHKRTVLAVVIIGLCLQILELLIQPPTIGPLSNNQIHLFGIGIVLVSGFIALALFARSVRFPALAAAVFVFLAIGLLIITAIPAPHIDVFVFGRGGAAALLQGHNPYRIFFRNIYNQGESNRFYGQGVALHGLLMFGYPYPPVPLFAALPGAIAGDFRLAYLAATGVAVWMIARCRESSDVAIGAAAVMLLTPQLFHVIESGWVEPIVVLLLSATVWTALRHPRWLAIPLGLLLVSKQYMIFAVPAVWLLLPGIAAGKRLRFLMLTVLVGAAVSLPLAIGGGTRFWQSVVEWQLRQPFRPDSISYPASFARAFPALFPDVSIALFAAVLAFVLAFAVLAVCLWRAPRTPAGFAATVGIVLTIFFAFNKQAFGNYYFLTIAAFCVAASAAGANADLNRATAQ